MRTLTEQLTQYAAYHRDKRNIATQFVGIPMMVIAIAMLLGRPMWTIAMMPFTLSPAHVLFAATTVYYLALDVSAGLMMAVLSALCLMLGQWLAAQSTPIWLSAGLGLFIVGWVFQFVGHIAYEHRKPAFVDDLIGLAIGPLFLLAEALFGLGWRPALRAAIEAQAGASRINRSGKPADQPHAQRH